MQRRTGAEGRRRHSRDSGTRATPRCDHGRAQATPAATPLTKEQALAILSDRGEKQLGNWINVDRKGGNWHFAATWKSGTAAYYVVDGMTGEILYSNPNTDNEAVPERFQQAEAQASFHIVDHGLKPTVWAESDR